MGKRKLDEMIEESATSLEDKDDSPMSSSEEGLPRYCTTQPTDEEMRQLFKL